MEDIINRLKSEIKTTDVIYRKIKRDKNTINIVYSESLSASDSISDFIIRSLNTIKFENKNIIDQIENNISNFKVSKLNSYEDVCFYLNSGFTIITVNNEKEYLSLEAKRDLSRGVTQSDTENSMRGPKDGFVEDYQKNLGLIKKRIRSNDFYIDDYYIGEKTKTKIGIMYLNDLIDPKTLENITGRIKKINSKGLVDSGMLKKLFEKEHKTIFPTILSTQRPDTVTHALLKGKIVILVDNSPYALVLPNTLNDFIKSGEDFMSKDSIISFTRAVKYIALFISLLAPAIYISLITYNQEIIPTDLLISFAIQRDQVPFPAFFEAFLMITAFEILRESDLRVPAFRGSSLSIVGALILGEASVSAGIVSPIMIIIVAITAISSLPFSEPDLIGAIRGYRILFMLGATVLGIIGVLLIFLYLVIKLSSVSTFGEYYLSPFVPFNFKGFRDSILKLPRKKNKNEKN